MLIFGKNHKLKTTTFIFFIALFFQSGLAQIPYTKHYTVENGLPSNTVYNITQDANRYLWISTNTGVSKFDGYAFSNYTVFDGLLDNEIIDAKIDNKKNIWFLGYNETLTLLKNKRFINEDKKPNFKINNLQAIKRDTSGKVYFISNFNKKKNVFTLNKQGNPSLQYSLPAQIKALVFTKNNQGYYIDNSNNLFEFSRNTSSLR